MSDHHKYDRLSPSRPQPRGILKNVSYHRDSVDQEGRGSASFDLRKNQDQDETSPLIQPQDSTSASPLALSNAASPTSHEWNEAEAEESKSSWYLLLLTLSIGGLQIAWSVELSNGSPYLLSLGISKSLLAFVWIAGPLSGTLVQPYVGIKSDRCRSKWGKRRPFIVCGALATIVSLLLLAWTKEIVRGFFGLFAVGPETNAVHVTSIVFAVSFIYILDFSINTIQAAIRAFIVDNAPTHQQNDANAWASRISGMGNILGYLSGYVNLPEIMPFFGNTQFKVLCVIACLALTITVGISCLSIQERDPRLEGIPPPQKGGVFSFFVELYRSMQRLPVQVKRVCMVQFFAWIGWFPFLFYITTFIGEIYVDPYFEENPHMTPAEIDKIWERATRVGTLALLIFAITNLFAAVVLPMLVAPGFAAPSPLPRTPLTPAVYTPTTPRSMSGSDYFAYTPQHSTSKLSLHEMTRFQRFKSHIPSFQIQSFTLRRAWILSHLLFALATWMTFFVRNTTQATILVAFIGFPWALSNWAPFALIAAEISKRDTQRRNQMPVPATAETDELSENNKEQGADQAGVILGIHNVAIAAPQVIATLVSSAIFKALQKPRGTPGDDSVAWVLRFGGLAAVVAAFLTVRIKEEGAEEEE